MEWAQVRALVADGVSEREIARRLGINRRTVARLASSDEPPRVGFANSGGVVFVDESAEEIATAKAGRRD